MIFNHEDREEREGREEFWFFFNSVLPV